MPDVQERIQAVMRDVFDLEGLVIRRDMTALEVEEWDSLSHINLIVAIEKEFSLRLSLAEVKGLQNVGEMLDLIRTKTGLG